jgi:uncharacterized protein (DUF58 family)
MLTLKAVAFLSAGLLLVIVAIMALDMQLLVLGVVLLSFLAASKVMKLKVQAVRQMDTERVLEGERITVKLRVRNSSAREAFVVLYDELPPEVRLVKGSNRQVLVLEAGKRTKLEYTIEAPLRGHFTLGPLKVRRRDFFNLHFEEEVVDELSYFSVYPRVPELETFPVRSYQSSYFELLPLHMTGIGYEFFCIRDYIKGDPLKRINWKVYARSRELMVNEYEKENLNDAFILLDAREVTKAGSPLANPLEVGVKLAASVASFLLKGRNEVGLITYGGKENAYVVQPAAGKSQLDNILSVLVGVKAEGEEGFKVALDKARPFLTPRTTLVLISPLDNDDTIVQAAKDVACQHRFFVFSPNSYEIEREVAGAFTSKHTMLELEKRVLLDELQSYGAITATLSAGQVLPDIALVHSRASQLSLPKTKGVVA